MFESTEINCCALRVSASNPSDLAYWFAEDLGIRRIATRDVRHFGTVRLRGGKTLDLVVNPTRPDRS